MKDMTPKQFINYTQKIDKKGFAICDGISNNYVFSAFDILYPMFIFTGISFFMWLLLRWNNFRSTDESDKK